MSQEILTQIVTYNSDKTRFESPGLLKTYPKITIDSLFEAIRLHAEAYGGRAPIFYMHNYDVDRIAVGMDVFAGTVGSIEVLTGNQTTHHGESAMIFSMMPLLHVYWPEIENCKLQFLVDMDIDTGYVNNVIRIGWVIKMKRGTKLDPTGPSEYSKN